MSDPYSDFSNKIIEVCESCHTASCWYGEFMCDDSDHADTEKKTLDELRILNLEHEDNWSDKKMTQIYGSPSPFGFKEQLGVTK